MLKAKGIKLLTVKIALDFQNMRCCMAAPLLLLLLAFCFLLTFAAIYKKWYRNLMLE